MKRTLLIGLAGLLIGASFGFLGCASKDHLTYESFRQLRVQESTEEDVSAQIGDPSSKLDGAWIYNRPDKHLTAMVDFDEHGRVTRLQWVDAAGEVWEDSADKPAARR